ncbi:MAG: phosphoribosylglycinamide formyltransferase [Gracilimonas sp.]|nr:phosphoribosylglycinamide formyltransferase [Gracilimonas sp.]
MALSGNAKFQSLLHNIVVFASGSGTNFQSIIDAVKRGDISARIAGLITNRDHIKAIQRAEDHSIAYSIIDPDLLSDSAFSKQLLDQLDHWDTDIIALAGYLKKIPAQVVEHYENRILNIHPSLLPKYGGKGFFGLKVHKAVLASDDAETGCSVHIVTQEFDEGPVIAQSKVRIKPNDTPEILAKRVLAEEHKLYPKAIQNHIKTSL